MKKTIILSALMAVFAISANAQFKIFSAGNANVMCNTEYAMNMLSVGLTCSPTTFSNYKNGIQSIIPVVGSHHNIGLFGEASSPAALGSGRAIGVLGTASNSSSGYNYGVFGRIGGSQNGAAIYGRTDGLMGFYIDGRYAGYFCGPTYVEGTITATDFISPSDIRLKENIVSLSDAGNGTTLNNLLGMNVIEYNYKSRELPEAERDTLNHSNESSIQSERHYGLSAQELQAIYPNLVKEGQDGYLGVNYVELVPVLIRAIQELKGELDAVKGTSAAARRAPAATTINDAFGSGNVLYQNTPNPFKEQTTVRFSLADDAQSASICIFDMTGKMLKNLPISKGDTSVSVNGWELGEGMFLYTLIVNGKEIDTKRMIITK